MKVQLIVVQGKPEGKTIPLLGPTFKIGRGETCHLRPNSEQVSREHSEFTISAAQVVVRDLGSRNGTLVNGKPLTEPCTLKDRDLIQIGPLTFAISIEGAPVAAAKKPATKGPVKHESIDDVNNADIESWLIADSTSQTPERPSGIYGGDTQTISTYRGGTSSKPAPPEETETEDEGATKDDMDTVSDEEATEEFIDESNPFMKSKKKPEAPVKGPNKDSSDVASDLLRKMMERRKSSR